MWNEGGVGWAFFHAARGGVLQWKKVCPTPLLHVLF
jgi:hypothetical protein